MHHSDTNFASHLKLKGRQYIIDHGSDGVHCLLHCKLRCKVQADLEVYACEVSLHCGIGFTTMEHTANMLVPQQYVKWVTNAYTDMYTQLLIAHVHHCCPAKQAGPVQPLLLAASHAGPTAQ